MKKRWMIWLLAAALAAGCSAPSGGNTETGGTSATEVTQTAIPEETEETMPEETTLPEEESGEEETDETEETDLEVEIDEGVIIVEAAVSVSGISSGIRKRDYVIKKSNSEDLGWSDVKKFTKEELNLARNEIYARRGYKFKNKDILNYFKGKKWYKPTVDPKDFSESVFNAHEKYNVNYLQSLVTVSGKSDLSKASSKKKVDSYGYEQGHSKLSFKIKKGTLKKKSGYYIVDAVYRQAITVSGKLKIGETVKVSFDDLTGKKLTLVRESDGLYTEDGARQFEYTPGKKKVTLYEDSADRVDKPVYEGKLYIRSDAVEGRVFGQEKKFKSSQVAKKNLEYNAVYFDSKGYVVRLMNIGD